MSMHSAQKKVHVNATKRDHCVRFCQFILRLPLRTQPTSLSSLSLSLSLSFRVCLTKIIFTYLFYYLTYFCYYL